MAGLGAAVASLPLSLARYRAWRLRKHMETVNALDAERHASQREVLLLRADKLANKTAAAYHIPTPWSRFVWMVVVVAWWAGFVVSGVGTFTSEAISQPEKIFMLYVLPGSLVLPCLAVANLRRSYGHTSFERERFIRRGCPTDYVARPAFDRADIRRRAFSRCMNLRDTHMMPAEWPPHSINAGLRRKVYAWRRGRPWYRGGFTQSDPRRGRP